MAILEAKVFQAYYGNSCVNTFHYTTNSIPAVVSLSFALAGAMGFIPGFPPEVDDLYGDWKDAVSVGVAFREVQIRSIYNVNDFYVQPLTVDNTGGMGGDPQSPTQAFGMQSSRVRQDIRRGNRRLVGVADGTNLVGGVVTAAQILLLNKIGIAMAATLTYDDEGNNLAFTPVVIAKEKYEPTPSTTAYRYYGTEIEQAAHLASGISWAALTEVRTQVSRQYGRGA